MEYLIWLVLVLLIGAVVWYKRGEGSPDAEEEQESVSRRGNSAISKNVAGKDEVPYNGLPSRGVRTAPTRSPPPPPPMRDGRGRPHAVPTRTSPQAERDSSLDLLTAALVLDALIPDSVPDAPTPSTPSIEPGGGSFGGAGAESSWSEPEPTPVRDNTDYGSSSSTDYGSSSSSDSGWSSSDSSSDSSSSSSSSSSD